jgi:hypothetical protein
MGLESAESGGQPLLQLVRSASLLVAFSLLTSAAPALVELQFLEVDQRVIERELIVLGAIHHRILDLFDEYCDRAFSRDQRWRTTSEEIARRGAALGGLFRRAMPQEESPT